MLPLDKMVGIKDTCKSEAQKTHHPGHWKLSFLKSLGLSCCKWGYNGYNPNINGLFTWVSLQFFQPCSFWDVIGVILGRWQPEMQRENRLGYFLCLENTEINHQFSGATVDGWKKSHFPTTTWDVNNKTLGNTRISTTNLPQPGDLRPKISTVAINRPFWTPECLKPKRQAATTPPKNTLWAIFWTCLFHPVCG